jgi:hypothetical protein
MEPEGTLMYSQESTIDPCPGPNESSLYPPTLFYEYQFYLVVLSSHVCPGLQSEPVYRCHNGHAIAQAVSLWVQSQVHEGFGVD